MLHRRFVTAAMQTALNSTFLTGIAIAPPGAAWDGKPNATDSNFVPYLVVFPMSSGPSEQNISASIADWKVPFAISAYGISPEQTEYVADAGREAIVALNKTVLACGNENYQVQQIQINSIGSLQRTDAVNPPYWGQTDQVTAWLSKMRA